MCADRLYKCTFCYIFIYVEMDPLCTHWPLASPTTNACWPLTFARSNTTFSRVMSVIKVFQVKTENALFVIFAWKFLVAEFWCNPNNPAHLKTLFTVNYKFAVSSSWVKLILHLHFFRPGFNLCCPSWSTLGGRNSQNDLQSNKGPTTVQHEAMSIRKQDETHVSYFFLTVLRHWEKLQ